MKQILRDGIVPANSNLPKWEEVFPNLIRPDKVKISDSFTAHPGALLNRPVENDVVVVGGLWSAGASLQVSAADGGYVWGTALTTTLGNPAAVVIGTGVAGQVMCRIKWGEIGGFAGLVFRFSSASNPHWRALLGNGLLQLQERGTGAAGVRAVTTPIDLVVGEYYDLIVKFDGDSIIATCGEHSVAYANGTSNQGNTSAGIYLYNTANAPFHQIHDFYVGL